MTTTTDVVIIGGGVTGTSAAFQLSSRGLRVLLVEKKFLAAGSTGRSSAIIRQHYSNEITARMAKYSLRVFQNFADIVARWAAAMISRECSAFFSRRSHPMIKLPNHGG